MTAEAPAPRSPMSYFQSLVMPMRYAQRRQDAKQLQEFLGDDRFTTNFAGLPGPERVRALGIMAEVMGAPPPVRRRSKFPQPRRCIKWDELTKARFQKAWAKGGIDAAALAVGISWNAAYSAGRSQGLIFPRVAKTTTNARLAA